ncbi:MAG: fumarylacetoacetate hydrolase family protein [Betaproteobacteria bacterium]|nr:fumarylacetoacetate hydrolase family protein [Betaproteobacteria bacterium]
MNRDAIQQAATILRQHWDAGTRIDELPPACRPADRASGYAIQTEMLRQSGQEAAGWKIAATSAAGQAHIAVDGPLAGRLWRSRVLASGATVSLRGNGMRVIEAEFAFRMGRPLPPRATPYAVAEVVAAASGLHIGMEIPDSRYANFVQAGMAQLIADNACASWYILGAEVMQPWRERDLVTHAVTAYRNGARAAQGDGSAVLGDPRVALAWIANELATHGEGLQAGALVTTGTCIKPLPVAEGDEVVLDFGDFGRVAGRFA